MRLETRFTAVDRMPVEIIRRQASSVGEAPETRSLFSGDLVHDHIIILNEARQIVFHSPGFTALAVGGADRDFMGLRLGEALGCFNARRCPDGCGLSESCPDCGALKAILSALSGRRDTRECRLLRLNGGGTEMVDLLVTTTPFDHQGESFCICSVSDLRNEKRHRAIESTFIKQLLESVGGLESLMKLLEVEAPAGLRGDLKLAASAFREIVDQVQVYRDLSAAERGELAVTPTPVDAGALLAEVVQSFAGSDLAAGVTIDLQRRSKPLGMVTDRALLNHVLNQLLKNAIEATKSGGQVAIGCDLVGTRVRFWCHNPGFIPREVQLQVYRRSFTTKGEGRGLGLYTVRLFAERYLGGRADFHTTPSAGTTFLVELPLKLPEPAPA